MDYFINYLMAKPKFDCCQFTECNFIFVKFTINHHYHHHIIKLFYSFTITVRGIKSNTIWSLKNTM